MNFLTQMAKWATGPTVRAIGDRANEAAANPTVRAASNYVAEVFDPAALESWTHPFEGPSRAVGALVDGRNPLQAASDPGMSEPNLSETLIGRGWSPGAAALMEFLVPDPTGAGGRAMDMVPIAAGLLRFGRSFNKSSAGARQVLAQAVERLAEGAPSNTSTYFDDLYNYARASGVQVRSELSNPRLPGWHMGDVIRMETPDARITLDHYDQSAVVRTVESLASGGRGDVSAQMRAFLPVLDLADANELPLYAFPDPFGPNANRNSATQLGEMYERLGFQYISDPGGPNDGWMIRMPLPVTEDESARFAVLAARRKNEVNAFGEALEPTTEQFHQMADEADFAEFRRMSDEFDRAADEGGVLARSPDMPTDAPGTPATAVAPSVPIGRELADRYDIIAQQANELEAIVSAGIAGELTRAEADRLFFNVDSLIQDLSVLNTPDANDRILFLEETKRMIQNLVDPTGGAR